MAARFALCPSRRRPLLDHYDVPLFESVSVGLLLLAGSRAVKNRATKKITQCLDRVGVQRLPRLPTGIEGSMRPGSGEASNVHAGTVGLLMGTVGLQGRPAACESPHHGPRRGLGLAPRPGQVGVHRRKAGNEMGWRYHPVSGPGRDSPTWQRSPAAAPRKWSGMQWPIACAHPWSARRSIWRCATAPRGREDCFPFGSVLPVHFWAVLPTSQGVRHSCLYGQDRGVLG